MAQRIPIQLHVANALQWLGTLYRSPADALKEHVSNAIDEHVKARLSGTAADRCDVAFTLDRKSVTIDYAYGMSRAEFETALRRVADSAKRAGDARTIGRLGIGIFSFQQIGRKCTFLSRKTVAAETLRVVLKEGSDEAVMEGALAREALARPGLRVVISELKFDPTKSRGPLAPDALRRYLAEKFEAYLREGWLTIAIRIGIAEFLVTPSKIQLPSYEEVPFESGSRAHSRFVNGVVQVNTLHPDYQQAVGSSDARLAYAALMIGKESIAWNDRSGLAADFLEKLLEFHFRLIARKPKRGRRRAVADGATQESLTLES